jgi:hypothetical protein
MNNIFLFGTQLRSRPFFSCPGITRNNMPPKRARASEDDGGSSSGGEDAAGDVASRLREATTSRLHYTIYMAYTPNKTSHTQKL